MDNFDLKKVGEASALLKLLSNENRLAILCYLAEGERSVNDLASVVGLSQSALSQHLAKLREQELVSTRREGQTIFYSVDSSEVLAILKTLQGLYCSE